MFSTFALLNYSAAVQVHRTRSTLGPIQSISHKKSPTFVEPLMGAREVNRDLWCWRLRL